jgi:hypothetical protein
MLRVGDSEVERDMIMAQEIMARADSAAGTERAGI